MSNKTRDSYHHGDLKSALLKAGMKILQKKGMAELSLREVAKQAGVSHNAPYRHFRNKTDLLCAIAQSGFEQLAAAMQQSIQACPDDAQKQILDAGERYVGLAVENPQLTQLMFGGLLDPADFTEEYCTASQSAFNGLLEILENGKKEGIYRNVETSDLAMTVWSLVHGLSMLYTSGQLRESIGDGESLKVTTRKISNLLLHGLLKE